MTAWTATKIATAIATHPIQLNVHKDCARNLVYPAGQVSASFEAVRASQVLSARGVLVSERSYPKDEESFEGLVDFVDLKSITDRVQQLKNMTIEEFSELVRQRYEKFNQTCNPERLFQNADVYTLLFRLSRNYIRSSSSSKTSEVNRRTNMSRSGESRKNI